MPFIVPIWAATSVPLLLPFVVFLVMQYWVRSFWDFSNAWSGLNYSLVLSSLLQLMLKAVIGALRPNFLDVCKPKLPESDGKGFVKILYGRELCTGEEKDINFAMTSFPSGHATAAWACYFFLFLYLNAKFKPWSNRMGSFAKLMMTMWPLVAALLVACSVVTDYHHHWYDAVAGAIIGILTAFCGYRAVYASVWDFRYNHIPLSRNEEVDLEAGHGR